VIVNGSFVTSKEAPNDVDLLLVLPVNPRNYAIIAQGPLDEIRKLQAEVDEYLGLREPAATADALRETPSGGEG
jgi:hypothetical protein